jgi:RNA polymerase sigma-70 factor (ECF subfamily)
MTAEGNLDRLIESVLAGDRDSYRDVIVLCEAKVRIVLAAILPDSSVVDDLAQEVFVTAFTKLQSYRAGTDFELWLKAIARNLALNERRRWLRNARFKDKFQAEVETALEPAITAFAEGYEGTVLEALRECLQRLEQPSRAITEDFYYHDLSSEQIAARLGRKGGWVRLILFRARAALAACLQTKGVS